MATAPKNRVRIYAVADIHGRPERLKQIRDRVKELSPDVVVAAGDITNFRSAGRVLAQLDGLPVPVLAIRGNTDRFHVETLFRRFANIFPLHLNPFPIRGIRIAGVSGTALLPFRSFVHYRERPLLGKLAVLVDQRTVVVTHPPPWGVLDEVLGRFHVGSRRLRETILRSRPPLILFGHIHEGGGRDDFGGTVAVNCTMGKGGAGAVVDLVDGRVDEVVII